MTEAYGASTVKRRTGVELAELDTAIIAAATTEHPVTLRGIYYRVVSAGAIDKTELGYRAVGRRLLALRRNGRVPYHWITDGTRWITKPDSWSDLDQMLDDAAASYRRALWRDQSAEVHVFTEKDAISGVILPETARWDVPLGVLRGYASESFAHNVAEAIHAVHAAGRTTFVYQLGDHDPSGLDAWRDFRRKVVEFLREMVNGRHLIDLTDEDGGEDLTSSRIVNFERLAVTEDQIQEYGLPTRPTKRTDSRAKGFRGESVEVDAIPPRILRGLVSDAIVQHIDPEALRLTRVAEDSERDILLRMRGQPTSGGTR